jgi:hypothetical protein
VAAPTGSDGKPEAASGNGGKAAAPQASPNGGRDAKERTVGTAEVREGPPRPFHPPAPDEVVSALDWFEPSGVERSNSASEEGMRHRRKIARNPAAVFRPREKRNYRGSASGGDGSDASGGQGS